MEGGGRGGVGAEEGLIKAVSGVELATLLEVYPVLGI